VAELLHLLGDFGANPVRERFPVHQRCRHGG
jgi:hypothetical protein